MRQRVVAQPKNEGGKTQACTNGYRRRQKRKLALLNKKKMQEKIVQNKKHTHLLSMAPVTVAAMTSPEI